MPATESNWANASKLNGTYNDTDYSHFIGNSYANSAAATFAETHKFLSYKANLKNLTPATRYQYRIGDGKGDHSEVRYFKTSGADTFSFVWISDVHVHTPSSGRLTVANNAINYAISQAPNQTVDMVFTTGDMLAYGGSYYYWEQMYNTNWAKNNLFVNTNGNHDNMNNLNNRNKWNYFSIMHNNPRNCFLGTSTTPYEPGVVYWFLYNNILWFVLDNETQTADITSRRSVSSRRLAADIIH